MSKEEKKKRRPSQPQSATSTKQNAFSMKSLAKRLRTGEQRPSDCGSFGWPLPLRRLLLKKVNPACTIHPGQYQAFEAAISFSNTRSGI